MTVHTQTPSATREKERADVTTSTTIITKKKRKKENQPQSSRKKRISQVQVKEGLLERKVMEGEGEKTLPVKVHFTSTDFGRNPSVCEEEEEEEEEELEGKEPAPVGGAAALGRLYM